MANLARKPSSNTLLRALLVCMLHHSPISGQLASVLHAQLALMAMILSSGLKVSPKLVATANFGSQKQATTTTAFLQQLMAVLLCSTIGMARTLAVRWLMAPFLLIVPTQPPCRRQSAELALLDWSPLYQAKLRVLLATKASIAQLAAQQNALKSAQRAST